MTILITGGAGFIGTRLIAALGPDSDVVVLDNLHSQVHGEDAPDPTFASNVRFIRGDVTDPRVWDVMLSSEKPATLVHLAAETGTGQSLLEATRHTNVNVNGTAVMLDALHRAGHIPQSIVLTSSRAVYGEGAWFDAATGTSFYGRPRIASQLDEGQWLPLGPDGQTGTPLAHDASAVVAHPSNVYAATKLAQENILTAWCTSLSVPLSILRLQNVYGSGQALRNPYTGVLTAFARQSLSGAPIDVYEDGGIVRDFVHVSDVVAALTSAIERPAAVNEQRILDIGSGASNTLLHFATVLASAAGFAEVTVSKNYRLGDVRAAFAVNSRANAELGYEPRVDFADGANELLAWARAEILRGE